MQWNTPEVKQFNSEKIRKQIQQHPKCTKSMVAKATSLSIATCNTIFNEMLSKGEILSVDQEDAMMGRPATRFEYNADYHHVMGISLLTEGKDAVHIAIGNALGEIVDEEVVTCKEITKQAITELVERKLKEDGLVTSISIGIPGVTTSGIIESCDFEGLTGEPLEQDLKDAFGLDVMVGNDMDFISCGLYRTAFEGKGNFASMLYPAEGEGYVGVGAVINGRVLQGFTHFAGEISYVAEAFGVSRQEMHAMRGDKEKFLDFVVKTVVIMAATIDPEEIILMGNNLEVKDAATVREGCAKILSQAHTPKILVDNKIEENYMAGLIQSARNRMDFPISRPM